MIKSSWATELKDLFTDPAPYILLVVGAAWVGTAAIVGGHFYSHPWWGATVGLTIFVLLFLSLTLIDRH